MQRLMLLMAAALLATALVGAGCGDDDDDDGGGGGGAADTTTASEAPAGGGGGGAGETRLELTADPGGALEFDETTLRADAGRVTIALDNRSDVPHAVEIEGQGIEEESDTVTGSSTEVTADLELGEYTFYCPVGNHREAGMEGTLTVG